MNINEEAAQRKTEVCNWAWDLWLYVTALHVTHKIWDIGTMRTAIYTIFNLRDRVIDGKLTFDEAKSAWLKEYPELPKVETDKNLKVKVRRL